MYSEKNKSADIDNYGQILRRVKSLSSNYAEETHWEITQELLTF